ncbi:MAG: hypothetical protein K2P40_05090 [Lachnospiraceae bacterium]|nr:hypothetical protein [Lachnospiraceae bacterium]
MSLRTFLWTEDCKGGAGCTFWENLLKQLCPEVVVESKRNNSELVKAFDLTRNTGFEVSKGTIGDCWIKTCCEWSKRDTDDICGLDDCRLNAFEKMKTIFDKTILKAQFGKVGLEVSL